MEPNGTPLSKEMSKPKTESCNMQVALKLACLGLPIFPCHSGFRNPKKLKAPHVKNGFYDATTDFDLVQKWWMQWPDALVGLPTGKITGLSVLDGDFDKVTKINIGEIQIERLGLSHPRAIKIRTPSNGVHFYFAHVEGISSSTRKVDTHIDVRGDGGYVIAPESILPDGSEYRHENQTIYEAINDFSLPRFPKVQIGTAKYASKPKRTAQIKTGQTSTNYIQTTASSSETLEFVIAALKVALNNLCREDWVKLAASLKVEFGDTLQNEFISYSLRYKKGDCTINDATHVWNTAIPHTVTSVAPALSLLKSQMGEDTWKVLWKNIFRQREGGNIPRTNLPETNEMSSTEVSEKQIDPIDLWNKFDPPELPRGLLPKKNRRVRGFKW